MCIRDSVYVAKTKTLREDKKIRLVVDLENSIKAQQDVYKRQVTDGVDSLTRQEMDITPFKNILNDMYSRDKIGRAHV